MDTLDDMAANARQTIINTAEILAYRVEASEQDFAVLDACVAVIDRELRELYAYHYFREQYEELCASADALMRVEQYVEAAS
jgi:hypothetical protein